MLVSATTVQQSSPTVQQSSLPILQYSLAAHVRITFHSTASICYIWLVCKVICRDIARLHDQGASASAPPITVGFSVWFVPCCRLQRVSCLQALQADWLGHAKPVLVQIVMFPMMTSYKLRDFCPSITVFIGSAIRWKADKSLPSHLFCPLGCEVLGWQKKKDTPALMKFGKLKVEWIAAGGSWAFRAWRGVNINMAAKSKEQVWRFYSTTLGQICMTFLTLDNVLPKTAGGFAGICFMYKCFLSANWMWSCMKKLRWRMCSILYLPLALCWLRTKTVMGYIGVPCAEYSIVSCQRWWANSGPACSRDSLIPSPSLRGHGLTDADCPKKKAAQTRGPHQSCLKPHLRRMNVGRWAGSVTHDFRHHWNHKALQGEKQTSWSMHACKVDNQSVKLEITNLRWWAIYLALDCDEWLMLTFSLNNDKCCKPLLQPSPRGAKMSHQGWVC